MEEVDLKEMIRQNQEMLTAVDKRLHKIERHFRLEMVLNWIKWLIIVVPIVFGLIYISPYVKGYVRMLQPALEALNLEGVNTLLENGLNNNSATTGVLENLCDPVKRQAVVNEYCK